MLDWNLTFPSVRIEFLEPNIDGINYIALEKITIAGTSHKTVHQDQENMQEIDLIGKISQINVRLTPQIFKFWITIATQIKEEPKKQAVSARQKVLKS